MEGPPCIGWWYLKDEKEAATQLSGDGEAAPGRGQNTWAAVSWLCLGCRKEASVALAEGVSLERPAGIDPEFLKGVLWAFGVRRVWVVGGI